MTFAYTGPVIQGVGGNKASYTPNNLILFRVEVGFFLSFFLLFLFAFSIQKYENRIFNVVFQYLFHAVRNIDFD